MKLSHDYISCPRSYVVYGTLICSDNNHNNNVVDNDDDDDGVSAVSDCLKTHLFTRWFALLLA